MIGHVDVAKTCTAVNEAQDLITDISDALYKFHAIPRFGRKFRNESIQFSASSIQDLNR